MGRALSILAGILVLWAALPSEAEEIVINAVGDIMLAGKWTPVFQKKGYDFPFDGIRAELAGADINLANLESPIANSGTEFTRKKYRFRAEPDVTRAMGSAGFNLVTLANNHSMDFGDLALAETFGHLDNAGISWIGAGKNLEEARKMVLYTIKGKRVAFLGYSLTQPLEFFAGQHRPGTTPAWEYIYKEDIGLARQEADYVIVSFHWGQEGQAMAHPNQRAAAHKAIEAGADAVIGHHPHVLQGVERYKGGIIFYSLGNFAFASSSRTAEFGALLRLRLDDTVREAEVIPLDVLYSRVRFQPQPLSGEAAANVIKRLNDLSRPFETVIEARNGRYYVSF